MNESKSNYGSCINNRKYTCPVEATVHVVGEKWKSSILYLLLEDKKRFNEFRRIMPGISKRMLKLQLRELEQHGIIQRKSYNEMPPKVEYSLTDFGVTLLPVLYHMNKWGEKYITTIVNKNESN